MEDATSEHTCQKAESRKPACFVSNLLSSVFGEEHFPQLVELDRAHILGSQPVRVANRPRILIVRIHKYRIKELITRLAIPHFPVMYKGQRIYIFQDLPTEIVRHKTFKD